LNISGNSTQNPGGALEIEFGGLTPGETGHDQINVTGTATLAGRLEAPLVDLGNGFVPSVGDEITFLTAGTRVGAFNTPVAPNLKQFNEAHHTNLAFQAVYGPTSVKLRVIERSLNGIEFDSVFEEADWSNVTPGTSTWSTNALPEEKHVIEIENLYDAGPQTVNVDVPEATVNQLTVSDPSDPITLRVQPGSTLTSQTDVHIGSNASLSLESTSTLNTATLTLDNAGLLRGNGVVKATTVTVSGGVVSPGFSVGQLNIEGDYEQTSTGQMRIEVDSSTTFDKVDIVGTADLGGTLTVDVTGATLTPGAPIQIITADDLADGTRFDDITVVGNNSIYFRAVYQDAITGGLAPSRATVTLFDGTIGDLYPTSPGLDAATDVPAFALALADIDKYRHEIGDPNGIDPADAGNCDHSATLDYDDIDDFVALFPQGMVTAAQVWQKVFEYQSVPEPGAICLALVALTGSQAAQRRLTRRRSGRRERSC
jgi:hypothetical protein